ncbi:hypothetical protein BABINDRAFT_134959 [Babjeviella inositovora NRRL Y-12698]|uniref:Uncharacterized protein n=1 Tax=Babjeviella inositovora NRRL Y-12698 TaxID=984486 RepID=A0A1E3QQ09_9ASCO|nr:uncharacterized protein BABINDRAFT_134959 [Babjeviella inositovora NRRL Y-12698]ODQ79728.1 hypothetical protein BABINDRAFT_134959 [Babjeviella inositovora NRRL Y-12698]
MCMNKGVMWGGVFHPVALCLYSSTYIRFYFLKFQNKSYLTVFLHCNMISYPGPVVR